jgi:quinol monooxygenase YgiN
MFISILHGRARSPDAAREICRRFYQSLELHQEPGWIAGGCAINVADPREVYIHEHWSNRAAWEAWRASLAERFLREQAEPLLESELELALYQE